MHSSQQNGDGNRPAAAEDALNQVRLNIILQEHHNRYWNSSLQGSLAVTC